jgi:hypothetical protein
LRKPTLRKFDRGGATVSYELADDGIVCASIGGLLLPANAGEMSALLLKSGADLGACGVLCSVQTALVALPPIEAKHYGYVPSELRAVPVAVVVSPEQMAVYEHIAQAAARSGAIRRAFLSRDEAQAWLREQVRALAGSRAWWSVHQAPP